MIGVVPAGGKLAFVVALNGDRLHHRNPDGHMGSRHPADAGVGQALEHGARIRKAGVDDAKAG